MSCRAPKLAWDKITIWPFLYHLTTTSLFDPRRNTTSISIAMRDPYTHYYYLSEKSYLSEKTPSLPYWINNPNRILILGFFPIDFPLHTAIEFFIDFQIFSFQIINSNVYVEMAWYPSFLANFCGFYVPKSTHRQCSG